MNAQDIDRGIETNMSVFRRPCLMIKLEHKPPNKAPKRDKLAIHDPCCCVILMLGKAEENVGIWSASSLGRSEAKAGEV